jgi:hypothetical protein
VSDDQRIPRPLPGPRPSADPTNYLVDRRKIILGLGFGIASAAGLRSLGGTTKPAEEPTSVETSAQPADVATVTETASFDPPVLEPSAQLAAGQTADVVFTGGRIIDPETGFDRVGNVAVVGSVIVAISEDAIPAERTVDVTGHVISPGFIDMLSYEPNGYGEWWKVADGVTANLGMHGLRFAAADFYNQWEGKSPVHFGGAVHNSHVREGLDFDVYTTADGTGLSQIRAAVERQVRDGYFGVHTQPEYTPGVEAAEMVDMATIAERLGVPFTVHARYSDNVAPGLQSEAVTELVNVARETGAHVHIEHLNSTGGTGRMDVALGQIADARAEGLRMTACMYPYDFWATGLATARYSSGWQERFGITYEDLQVAGTDSRLTAESFQEAQAANKLTAAFAIPPEDIVTGFGADFMMIGSDAILETSHNNHPRSTGCYSRVLGKFVREDGVVPLIDALAMMTIRPAELTGIGAPAMRRKGRMQIGADADITVFNLDTITDNSTIADPAQESTGVVHVMVNGVDVRANGVNVKAALPGSAIKSATV